MKRFKNVGLQHTFLFIKLVAGTCKRSIFLLLSLTIISIIVPIIEIFLIKELIGSIENDSESMKLIFAIIGGLILVKFLSWSIKHLQKYFEVIFENSIREKLKVDLVNKFASLDYEKLEDSKTWELFDRIITDFESKVKNVITNIFELLVIIFRIFALIVIVSSFIRWMGIGFLILSIPLFVVAYISGKRTHDTNVSVHGMVRAHKYKSSILVDRAFAYEREIYDYSEQISN